MKPSALLRTLPLLVGVIVLRWDHCQGSRILMIPGFAKSHQSLIAGIAEELLRRQHDVYVYMGEAMYLVDRLEKLPVKMLKYRCDDPDFPQKLQDLQQQTATNAIEKTGNLRAFYATMSDLIRQECDRVLSDETLLNQMESLNFDIIIVDDMFLFRCLFLLPHRLGVRFISLIDFPEPWPLRLPWLPSSVPFRLFPLTEKMSFWQRLTNTFGQLAWIWMPISPQPSGNVLERYQAYGDFDSLNDVCKNSLLYLMTSDYHLDYALPMMPFMIPVPGLTIVPNGQLPVEYTNILDQSPGGVIVVTFGAFATSLPKWAARKLAAAFAAVNNTVFWKSGNVDGIDVPKNVHTREWLPQNELLAHPKVKLFITHGGNNGQHEAVYHGVPMIVFPFFSEQPYNALRVQRKGLGIAMDIATFTPDELVTNINKVINDPTYTAAISKVSKMFRERPESSAQKAAFWIEHVIEYGADHLHSYSQYMPWYQFLMLDIAALSFLVLVAICWSIRKLFSCIIRVCCKSRKRKIE